MGLNKFQRAAADRPPQSRVEQSLDNVQTKSAVFTSILAVTDDTYWQGYSERGKCTDPREKIQEFKDDRINHNRSTLRTR